MKITIVGSDRYWNSLERHYLKHLQKYAEVVIYPFPQFVEDYYSKSLFRRGMYRFELFTKNKILQLNEEMLNAILQSRSDIIWIFKGVNILPEILHKIKCEGIKLVNYNADHPFIRTFRSSGGNEIEDCIPFYDLFISYSMEINKMVDEKYFGKVKTAYLPFGVEMDKETALIFFNKAVKNEIIDRIGFIGQPDNEFRRQTIEALASRKIPVDVFGEGWNKYMRSGKYIKINKSLGGSEYWEKLTAYRVQLNIFRPHNYNSHNMRTFEIPAVGGLQLAPYSEEHEKFYSPNREIFLYKHLEDLTELASEILRRNANDLMEVRKQAFERTFIENYTYQRRSRDVMYYFEELM